MKATVVDYRYAARCLRIVTRGGTTVRLTSFPRDLVIGGNTYQTDSGYEFTGHVAASNTSPAAMDLSGIIDIAGISEAAIQSGQFDNARIYCFDTNYRSPVEDEEPIFSAIFGKATLTDGRYTVEMMQLMEALNQTVGETSSAKCSKAFGGQEFAGCKVALGPLTVTGSVTAVTSGTTWQDSARSEADDWFGAGVVTWLTGLNAGLRYDIKSHTGTTLETFEAAYYGVTVGDTYSLVPGCRKRLVDCRDKYNNILNSNADYHMPTSSQYGQVGTK